MSDPRDQEPEAALLPDSYDINIEQAVLGACLIDNRHVMAASAYADPVHFYDPLHARVFEVMQAMLEDGDVITPLTLSSALRLDPGLLEVGGVAYLAGLAAAAPAMPNVRAYSKIVRDFALRRDAVAALADATTAVKLGAGSVSKALKGVLGIAEEAERLSAASNYQSAFDAGMESIRDAERAASGKPVRAVRTGLAKMDTELGGLRGGDFIVVAGKSGMGKSALMGGISWKAATRFYPVLVISLEMKRKPWVQRQITDIDFDDPDINGPLEYRKFRAIDAGKETFSGGEFERAVMANRKLEEIPWMEVYDEDGLTLAQIAARARAFQSKWKDDPRIRKGQGTPDDEDPIGLVIIDYLQIVDPASRQYRPREQEVRDIARGSKALAKNLDWPVMAGSQLNEDEKGRGKENKRPQASDVRESKSIVHEADVILLPYREAQALLDARPDSAPGEPTWINWNNEVRAARHRFDAIIGKNRHGRRTTIEMFGDMRASAVRDESPFRRVAQQEADDLLKGLQG